MPMGQYQNGNLGSAGEIGKYAVRFVCGWNMAMFSSAVRSADRGGAAGGGVRKESTSPLFQPRRKAALRLTVNPFGSDEPLPLSRHWHGDTGGDIAA